MSDGTTLPEDSNEKRWTRHQRLRSTCLQHNRPMWQEPLRGALRAAGSGIIGVAFAWLQAWL